MGLVSWARGGGWRVLTHATDATTRQCKRYAAALLSPPPGTKLGGMSDEPDSMVLRYLRRIDEKVDRMAADVADLKVRTTAIEQNVAITNGRLDRIEARLERIERRLDLVEA